MPSANSDPLLLAGKVLTIIMQGIMVFAAVVVLLVLILLPGAMLFGVDVAAEAASEFPDAPDTFPLAAVFGLLAIAFVLLSGAFIFFGKLRHIIDTVGEGDPFAPVNAQRLSHMAWLLLGLQLLFVPATGLGLLLAKWADEAENANVTVDAAPDLEGLLMVVVLFILARVFKHGAAMREDLEGTV